MVWRYKNSDKYTPNSTCYFQAFQYNTNVFNFIITFIAACIFHFLVKNFLYHLLIQKDKKTYFHKNLAFYFSSVEHFDSHFSSFFILWIPFSGHSALTNGSFNKRPISLKSDKTKNVWDIIDIFFAGFLGDANSNCPIFNDFGA